MTNRRIIVIAIGLVSAAAAAVRFSASGRLPEVTHALDAFASSVSATLSSSDASVPPPSLPPAIDGGGRDAQARRQATPLSNAQLGAPLVHGTFVGACGAPDDMKVVVKAAVKMGHATDVTVKTDPPNSAVISCVEQATRALQWDISPKVGHVTVTY